jgi:pimeloyl-ACP methyl ester carboxylesterase
LHGVGDTREGVVSLGSVFLRRGYAVLTPDLRGHGESGGFTSYGIAEAQDGFGASLGGAELLGSLDAEPRFRAVIAESAYSSFPAIAYERMHRAIPDGWKWLTGPFVDSGILWVRLRYGIDLRHGSPVDAVRRTHVIHGLKDDRTAPENSRILAGANPQATQLWLIPAAGHANAWAATRGEFESRVLAWFGDIEPSESAAIAGFGDMRR